MSDATVTENSVFCLFLERKSGFRKRKTSFLPHIADLDFIPQTHSPLTCVSSKYLASKLVCSLSWAVSLLFPEPVLLQQLSQLQGNPSVFTAQLCPGWCLPIAAQINHIKRHLIALSLNVWPGLQPAVRKLETCSIATSQHGHRSRK